MRYRMEYYDMIGKEVMANMSSIGEVRKFIVEYIHPNRGYKLVTVPTIKEKFLRLFMKKYKSRCNFHLCIGSEESYYLSNTKSWVEMVIRQFHLPEDTQFEECYKIAIECDVVDFIKKFNSGEVLRYDDIYFEDKKLKCPSDFDFTKIGNNKLDGGK